MDECCVPPDIDDDLTNAISKALMASPDDVNSDTVPELNKNTWDGLVEGKRGEGVGGGEKRKNTSKINLNTHQSKT